MRKNSGTIAKIRLKVVYEIFEVFVALRPAIFFRSESFLGEFLSIERVQTDPNCSTRVRKLRKTSENFEKNREHFYKNFFHGVII